MLTSPFFLGRLVPPSEPQRLTDLMQIEPTSANRGFPKTVVLLITWTLKTKWVLPDIYIPKYKSA